MWIHKMGVIHAQLLCFQVHLVHKMLEIPSHYISNSDSCVITGDKKQTVEQVAQSVDFTFFNAKQCAIRAEPADIAAHGIRDSDSLVEVVTILLDCQGSRHQLGCA